MGLPGPAARLLEDFGAFEDLPVALAVSSVEGRLLRANRPMCALLGRSETELLAADGTALVAPGCAEALEEGHARLVGGAADVVDGPASYLRPDGTRVEAHLRRSAVRDAAGAVALVVQHAVPCTGAGEQDAAALARAAARTDVLVGLAERLRADSRHPRTIASAAARALHGLLGGGTAVLLTDLSDGVTLEAAALVAEDPGQEAELRRLFSQSPVRTDEGLVGRACVSGRPLVVGDPLADGPVPADYAPWLEAHPVHALLLVPVVWEGRLLGVLAAGRHAGTPYDEHDVAYAVHVAAQASAALADALLLALERSTARRERAVARVTRRCDEALGTSEDLLEAAARAVGSEVGGPCAAWLLDWDDDGAPSVARAAVTHPDPEAERLLVPWLRSWAGEEAVFLRQVLRDGRALVVGRDQVAALASASSVLAGHADRVAVESLYGVRMTSRGQTVGMLAVASTSSRLGVDDRRLVDALADRVALALDNSRLMEAAQASRSRARALVEHCSDLLLMTDGTGAITYASPAAVRAFGGPTEAQLMQFVVPEDRSRVIGAWKAVLAQPGVWPALDVTVVDVEGRRRRLSAVANNLLDDPSVRGIVLTVRDVTEERQASERLAHRAGQQAALAAVSARALTADLPQVHDLVTKAVGETLGSTTSGVLQLLPDGDWLVLGASDPRAAQQRLPAPPRSSLRHLVDTGQPLLVDDYAVPGTIDQPDVVAEWGVRSGMFAPVLVDGHLWGAVTAHSAEPGRFTPVDLDFLGTVATVVAGAVERDAMSRRALAQAGTDELTGLPNRVVVHAVLAEELSVDAPCPPALLLLDLDDFKDVNDSLGHGVGDSVIEQLGRRLAGVVGERGTVARLGGDEFAVVLRGPDSCAPERLAEDIGRSIAEPFALGGLDVRLSASVGIAVAPEHGRTADALLQAADMAMYRAKLERSGWAVYDAELDSRRSERLALLAELRVALSAGELVLHYQPLVDLRTERVVAVEALLRWQHPRRGLLLPGEFLPTAEQTDLVHAVTRHVVRAAARQARAWRAAGWQGTVAVNVAAPALRPPEVVATLREELLRGDGTLTVELTESALFDERAREAVRTLAAAGISISVDDFGTGWSALSYLRELPVSRLKLDRAFNRDVDTDERDAAIVGSVVQMAHALDLEVVAEGVETAEVAARLRDLDVDVAQGWLYGRPQPASGLRLA
ncbi:MAG TPA: EAL domain-containing protein [Mycobacteriales bacterium]|nr:EAL domain-containing protein [Mycobacteriales bacterium]